MKQYLESYESYLLTHKRVALNTFAAYQRDVRQALAFFTSQGIEEAAKIDQKCITAYCVELAKHCGPRSVARKLCALRGFIAYMRRYQAQAIKELDFITPKATARLPRYCTKEEIARMLERVNSARGKFAARNRLILYLLYTTGIRVSELIGIRCEDIHIDTGILDIYGKGGKMRQVPLMPELVAMVKEHMAGVYLLGKKLTRQRINKIIRHLALKAMGRHVSPHMLRHSFATHSLREGWDLRSLQLMLGHERISTVQVYTHLETSQLRESYNKKHPRS